jgi:ferredoxin--NADP+ reductase
MRVAVVGSGPAGFYAAGALLSADPPSEVDMIERLPTPWGLVRLGVAPDHPKLKSVSRAFERIADQSGFRFLGNIEVGRDLHHDDLVRLYDAVIYAVGAQTDRRLGIPGEDLPGSWAATELVAWYNGHPDYQQLEFDLSAERAVVIGNGNVALDVARISRPRTRPTLRFRLSKARRFARLSSSGGVARRRPPSRPRSCTR